MSHGLASAYSTCTALLTLFLSKQHRRHDARHEVCGVQVHESCYGVLSDDDEDDNESNQADNTSNHSNTSSKSTEPWFCEPCIRSVKNPYCELCPNLGGIFKQTDTGRWVHMVCALYTRGVTFENIDTLTGVSLFELNYALFGSKVRSIFSPSDFIYSSNC